VNPTIDEMRRALTAAGWKPSVGSSYKTPDGRYYRGPALAYHVMMGLPWPPERWDTCPACSGCKSETFVLNGVSLLRRCSHCDGRGEIKL